MSPLILASASPRRRELLGTLGLDFQVEVADVDESILEGESPTAYVARTARAKAEAIVARRRALGRAEVVLAADTTVVVDGQILAKPEDDADARRMLTLLAGRTHQVLTAIVVISPSGVCADVIETRVTFRALDARAIAAYVASGEPRDKAGAYGIQGLAMGFVTRIEGSYTNVVGLPAAEVITLLERAGALGEWPRPAPSHEPSRGEA